MHIIPANEDVEYNLKQVNQGDIVIFSGSLVRIKAKDGWYWNTSLTRNDTGAHACEVIWVTDLYTQEF